MTEAAARATEGIDEAAPEEAPGILTVFTPKFALQESTKFWVLKRF